MPTLEPTNATLLDRVRLKSSNEYQQTIPEAGRDNLYAAQQALLDHPEYFNEFVRNLPVVLGKQKARKMSFRNPLAVFKKDWFADGKAAMEFAARLIDPIAYDPNDPGGVLRNYELPLEAVFYSVNRKVVYPVTTNESQARKSFNDVQNGINDYLDLMLSAPMNSNQYHEFRFMIEAFAAANAYRPFYNVQVVFADDNNPTEEELKNLSRQIRAYGYTLSVAPTGLYNPLGVPVMTPPEKLVLLVTPQVKAALEVAVLADAFNLKFAEFAQRVIVIDEMPWSGTHAILLDEDAVIAGDSLIDIEMFRNGYTLTTNYFLHVQGGYNISALGNVIVFSNTASTQIGVVEFELTSIAAHLEDLNGETLTTTVKRGQTAKVVVEATGSVTPNNPVFHVPDNWTASIKTDGYQLTPRTWIDGHGYLHVAKDVPAGTELTITVVSSYRDPSAPLGTAATPVEDEIVVTVAN